MGGGSSSPQGKCSSGGDFRRRSRIYIHMTGFFLLITLILYITWQDVVRLFRG
jgi:hypothetical protein